MSTLSKDHRELTNGVGKCSVPMWRGGLPSGFCSQDAYSMKRTDGEYAMVNGSRRYFDGRYDGYVPALACHGHGGKTKEQALNLCDFCKDHPATCKSDPEFGTGKGNDNVFKCSSFVTKNIKQLTPNN